MSKPVSITVDPQIRDLSNSGRFNVSPDDDPSVGSQNASVLIIEFSDFQCQSCRQFATETLPLLLEAYDGQIRLVYRDFPILGPVSLRAAVAAECADDQDAFWLYHDQLFENQNQLGRDTFIRFAEHLGLDMDQFAACLNDPTSQEEVNLDFKDASQLGARGTPTFFINGRIVVGAQPLSVFSAIFDEEIAIMEKNSDAEYRSSEQKKVKAE